MTPHPLDARLRAALARERPEPDAFLAGVHARVKAGAAARAEAAERWRRAPGIARAAAGVLPPTLLPLAAKAGLAGWKGLSWKAVPGLAALPAVSLLMLVLTFFGGLGAIRPRGDVAADPEDARRLHLEWWRRNWKPTLVVLVAIVALAVTRHSEAAVLALLASMVVTTLLLRELSQEGLADRRTVGAVASSLLFNLGMYGYVMRDLALPELPTARFAAPFVLIAAAITCGGVARRWTLRSVWRWLLDPIPMRHPDPVTTACLRIGSFGVTLFATLVLATSLVAVAGSVLLPDVGVDRTVAWLDAFEPSAASGKDWNELELVLWSLPADVLARADAEHLRAAVADTPPHFDAAPRLRAGYVPEQAPSRIRWVQDRPARAALRNEDAIRWLHATDALSPEALDAIARALLEEEGRFDPEHFDVLADLARTVRLVDDLGRPDLVDARRADVHALLRARAEQRLLWTSLGPDSRDGALGWIFGGSRRHFDRASALATAALFERLGVPEGVDPEPLREKLLAQRQPISVLPIVSFGEPEAAALLLLERAGSGQPRGLALVAQHRILVGALLLAALAITAVLRAPASVEGEA